MSDDPRTAAWDHYWTVVEGRLGSAPSGFLRWCLPWFERAPAGAGLVELGCGGGQDLQYLLRQGYRVRGVDASPVAVALTENAIAELPPDAAARGSAARADAAEFLEGLAPGSVAAVFGAVLYETLSDDELRRTFRAVRGALAAGGFHLWCVRETGHPLERTPDVLPPNTGDPRVPLVGHRFFTAAGCAELGADGFEPAALERREESHYLFVADRKRPDAR